MIDSTDPDDDDLDHDDHHEPSADVGTGPGTDDLSADEVSWEAEDHAYRE